MSSDDDRDLETELSMKMMLNTRRPMAHAMEGEMESAAEQAVGKVKVALASSRPGRVLLHAICLCRNPAHAHWHWRGMLRELAD